MTELTATKTKNGPLRILAISQTWHGANDYAFVRSFRRAGHAVSVVSNETFFPSGWTNPVLKGLRRLARPLLSKDYEKSLIAEIEWLQPELFFVFKGMLVTPAALEAVRRFGGVSINFYPDVSLRAHGPLIPRALPHYDWIFTTKTFQIEEMRQQFGISNASFLPHAYDPEAHIPITLGQHDRSTYGCDVAFVGTWSPKKEALLAHLAGAIPGLKTKIWGHYWDRARADLRSSACLHPVFGLEYAKAIAGSAISMALLSAATPDTLYGDRTTARTFEIPAIGGFMLHERTAEVQDYFAEGVDCAMFDGADELAQKVGYYLAHQEERNAIAAAGHRRCLTSGYSVDDRVAAVLAKFDELRS